MSKVRIAAAAAVALAVAAWPADALAVLHPDVGAQLDLAAEQLDQGNVAAAEVFLTNAKQLADQHKDWEGMLLLSVGYFLLGPTRNWELEDSYSLALQYAYDLAYSDPQGPQAGANCREGRTGLEAGIAAYDELFAGALEEPTATEMLYQRNHAQTNLETMNLAPCPP